MSQVNSPIALVPKVYGVTSTRTAETLGVTARLVAKNLHQVATGHRGACDAADQQNFIHLGCPAPSPNLTGVPSRSVRYSFRRFAASAARETRAINAALDRQPLRHRQHRLRHRQDYRRSVGPVDQRYRPNTKLPTQCSPSEQRVHFANRIASPTTTQPTCEWSPTEGHLMQDHNRITVGLRPAVGIVSRT
jgi:hypothetical protein